MEDTGLVIEFWHWFVLGFGLIILEMLVPGAVFLWMGVSAGLVGVILWLAPGLQIETQVFWFAALSIVAVVVWRKYHTANPTETEQPLLNRRGEQYVGRVFTLREPIVNGQGKVSVDDSTWKIHGDDSDAGDSVRVTGVDGVVLVVEKT